VVEVTPEGRVTRFSYDAQDRLLGTTSAAGTYEQRQSVRRYDAFGNLIGELNAEGSALYTSSMSASELDALYAQYGVRHSYDLLGRRIQSTDAAGFQTWYFHDAAGRV
ncbi:RHS repeat domain-containing protein, partial [Listeria seeligeri]|uniref:RHS repeat domain-containing protein n=1 Tax=Listeria seeligeri TaxID=1640 RepID=UPI0022EA959A